MLLVRSTSPSVGAIEREIVMVFRGQRVRMFRFMINIDLTRVGGNSVFHFAISFFFLFGAFESVAMAMVLGKSAINK